MRQLIHIEIDNFHIWILITELEKENLDPYTATYNGAVTVSYRAKFEGIQVLAEQHT